MEEVLSKHRKRMSIGSRNDSIDETDEDKMKHQLLLDVNGLLPYMKEMSLPVPESYNTLVTTVRSAYSKGKYHCLFYNYFVSYSFFAHLGYARGRCKEWF